MQISVYQSGVRKKKHPHLIKAVGVKICQTLRKETRFESISAVHLHELSVTMEETKAKKSIQKLIFFNHYNLKDTVLSFFNIKKHHLAFFKCTMHLKCHLCLLLLSISNPITVVNLCQCILHLMSVWISGSQNYEGCGFDSWGIIRALNKETKTPNIIIKKKKKLAVHSLKMFPQYQRLASWPTSKPQRDLKRKRRQQIQDGRKAANT